MSDQRAMLDACTNSRDCTADMHIVACPSDSRREEAEGDDRHATLAEALGCLYPDDPNCNCDPAHDAETVRAHLLTAAEHAAVAQAADLWGALQGIVADGPARAGDLQELIFHIHAIQRTVLKQAAARAYPELYRLLGGDPPPGPAFVFVPETQVCTTCKERA